MKLAAIVLVAVTGCSFVAVRGPESSIDPAGCDPTDPVAAPVIDGVLGAGGIITGGALLFDASNDDESGERPTRWVSSSRPSALVASCSEPCLPPPRSMDISRSTAAAMLLGGRPKIYARGPKKAQLVERKKNAGFRRNVRGPMNKSARSCRLKSSRCPPLTLRRRRVSRRAVRESLR